MEAATVKTAVNIKAFVVRARIAFPPHVVHKTRLMAAIVAALTLVVFALGYRFYGAYLGRRVFGDDETLTTPAHTREDGRDFVPTRKSVLFGHHYTSVAGAAPIIGPCVAAYWGWLPALLWITVGTLTMGAVHDFGALVVSVREGGRTVGDIAGRMLGTRVRIMFQLFVLLLVWLVLAVFAMAIAGLFVSQPTAVLPVNASIVLALVVGFLLYKRGVPPLWPSVIALVLLYVCVWIGADVPLDLTALGLSRGQSETTFVVLLLAYSAVASLLPVWVLLQPRDYINSHQLLVGLSLLFLGLFATHPDFDAPALRADLFSGDAPSLVPTLFVTIACGAISGFHGLVASGTTSKQLDQLKDARAIGYGSMVGEGALALASTMAAVAGIGLVAGCELPAQGAVADLSWGGYYDTWAHASANKATAFVLGGAAFLESLGLRAELARTLMAVLVISFAATSLDTATRIQRFVLQEFGETAAPLAFLRNRYVATLVAVVPALALATGYGEDPKTGTPQKLGWLLWPIFGASNQTLAAFTLLLLALYFGLRKRPIWPLVVPMVFVFGITVLALIHRIWGFAVQGKGILSGLASVLLALVVAVLVEALFFLRRR